jgi:hypothetical protein
MMKYLFFRSFFFNLLILWPFFLSFVQGIGCGEIQPIDNITEEFLSIILILL